LSERIYKISVITEGKVTELATFRVTVEPSGNVGPVEVISVSERPMLEFGTPKNADIPESFRRELGYEVGRSTEGPVAPSLTAAVKRTQLVSERLDELAVRLHLQGKSEQVPAVDGAREAAQRAERFLSNASPSDPRVRRIDERLRELTGRVGRWKKDADVDLLNDFTEAVNGMVASAAL
jgi:hypothetical protein